MILFGNNFLYKKYLEKIIMKLSKFCCVDIVSFFLCKNDNEGWESVIGFIGVIYFLVLMKELEGVIGFVKKIGGGGCLGFLCWLGGILGFMSCIIFSENY